MRVDSRAAPTTSAPTPQPRTWTTPSGTTYSEPPGNTALAKGHGGERVTDLQKKLNEAGIKPPLELDGLFGGKTEAALQKLTGSKSLDAAAEAALTKLAAPPVPARTDGFEVGKRPSMPEFPAVQVPSTVGKPPPTGSVAEKTLAIAQSEIGSVDPRKTGADGKYEGWQKLQNIFEKTTGWKPTDKEVQASSQPQKKSWCGIYAAHVLQEAGANVKWDLSKGKMTGDVKQVMQPTFRDWRTHKAERQAFEATVKPGDVITLNGSLNHHAIVKSVNADGTVNTIDGNKPHIGEGKFKLADVTSYYRPTGGGQPAARSAPAPSAPRPAPSMPSAPAPVPTPAGVSNLEGGQSAPSSGKSVGSQFHVDSITAPTEAQMKQRVDLSGDKASRIKAMSTFTQFDSQVSAESDSNACGAASIVAGAAMEGGPQGLQNLLKVIDERGDSTRTRSVTQGWKDGTIAEYGKLPGIKSRIESGQVTQQDLADLKTIVYKQLRQVEAKVGANSTDPTINIDAIREYINTDVKWIGVDQPIKGMFDDMNIKLVDTAGTGKGNHFVLMLNDGTGKGENTVYDPWPTRSGNQINQNQGDLLWYHHGVKNAVR